MGVIELFVGILLGNIYQHSVLITIYQAPAQNAYCPIKNWFYGVVKYSKRNNFNLLDQIRCFWWQGNSTSELVKAILGASRWRPFQEHLELVSLVMANNGLATKNVWYIHSFWRYSKDQVNFLQKEITKSKLPGTWGVLIHSQFTRVMAQFRVPCMMFFPKSQLYHMTGSTRPSPTFHTASGKTGHGGLGKRLGFPPMTCKRKQHGPGNKGLSGQCCFWPVDIVCSSI